MCPHFLLKFEVYLSSQQCWVAQSCEQNAYKQLSGEQGEQQGIRINNAKPM